jgi:hypothetical protein
VLGVRWASVVARCSRFTSTDIATENLCGLCIGLIYCDFDPRIWRHMLATVPSRGNLLRLCFCRRCSSATIRSPRPCHVFPTIYSQLHQAREVATPIKCIILCMVQISASNCHLPRHHLLRATSDRQHRASATLCAVAYARLPDEWIFVTLCCRTASRLPHLNSTCVWL